MEVQVSMRSMDIKMFVNSDLTIPETQMSSGFTEKWYIFQHFSISRYLIYQLYVKNAIKIPGGKTNKL